MCECSKRHLQRNGGQLAGVEKLAEGPAVNGYIKHVMRHHKGRGGHCPPITPPSKSIDRAAPARDHSNKNVSFVLLSFLVKEKFPSVFSNVVSRRNLRYLRVQIWRTLSAQSARLCQFIAGIKMNRHDDDPEPETQQKRGLKNKGLENNKNRSAFFSFLLMFCYCQPLTWRRRQRRRRDPPSFGISLGGPFA